MYIAGGEGMMTANYPEKINSDAAVHNFSEAKTAGSVIKLNTVILPQPAIL